MRRFLVILLCLLLITTACGTKEKIPEDKEFYHAILEMDKEIQKNIQASGTEEKIPEGMSEEFYHAMLIMDKEIQESLKTKELKLDLDLDKKYFVVFSKYIEPVIKEKYPRTKEFIEDENYIGMDNMTEKEKLIADTLFDTQDNLERYFDKIKENEESDIIEISKEEFEEKYKEFRTLLELEEIKIPEGMSKEFYHAMLYMDKEIQKSLETKKLTLTRDNEKYIKVYDKYILPVLREVLSQEVIKGLTEQGYYLGENTKMTEKEKLTVETLLRVEDELETYFKAINEDMESSFIEFCEKDFEEKYTEFKSLLELQ